MSPRAVGRLETLASVRRVEKTRQMALLSAARQEVDRLAAALLVVQGEVETLRASLNTPLVDGTTGAGVLTAATAHRRKLKAALEAAQVELEGIHRRRDRAEAALDAARDNAARAHRALLAVEKQL